ncbi:transient receptor potential protein-like [Macrobrachium nipponense]|uniref:transient receptor potential protein-like n=1 Tax=Macrobrachium nipponense TaxID=159736 RepID=UPI0030C82D09
MTANRLDPNTGQAYEAAPTPDGKNLGDLEEKIKEDLMDQEPDDIEQILNSEEKRYLLYVERGDVASVRHIVKKGLKQNTKKKGSFNINCLDPLGRSALIIAIENENLDMMDLLLQQEICPADGLLHAIAEEYVEGVEILLVHEEKIHVPGEPYSWQKLKGERSTFTPDITPLIMAAHRNHYEILKLLLDRGATIPMPHDIKCACDECLVSDASDSLRHSLARINAYKALASPSLICLSSKDPFITAFSLSEDLKKLSTLENEFTEQYTALRKQVQEFTMALVDETRTSTELEIILNYDPEGEPYKQGQFMHFTQLKEAVDSNQKQFVAHANVQQLLGRVWYDGMPGFKRRSPLEQLLEIVQIGALFPLYCCAFLLAPESRLGSCLKKPFIKFIVHSASYCFFLTLLVIVSLRVETFVIELFGTDWMIERLRKQEREARGGWPSFTELLIVVYIFGFILHELKTLWDEGLLSYIKDLWNFVDFGANFFYMNWIFLRLTALFLTQRAVWSGLDPYYPREMWPPFDPLLLSEAMFCAGNILSFLKLIHIFSINHHMGPLQIALGRMVVDIIKFFFIYTLVLFAFGCGLNNLLWYYADIDKSKCYSLPGGMMNPKQGRSCTIWRRFSNLFETSQSLFWASFGLVDLTNFELTGIKSFTRFWSMLMYGSYNVINVIVLLNLLIAMMSNSYTIIVAKCDVEWKFARSKLWMSYFEDGDEVPAPFNLIPNPKAFTNKKPATRASFKNKRDSLRDTQYHNVARNLVRRYVTMEQRRGDEAEITEDDINEVKQDVSSFKYELLNILKINGWMTGNKHLQENTAVGRKQAMRERRLMKGFNIGLVEGISSSDALINLVLKATAVKKAKKDWNSRVRKSVRRRDPIGSSSTIATRQTLRMSARDGSKSWGQIKFYQRRGVFAGGEINERMLTEIKSRIADKKPAESKLKGWRRLQKLHEKGGLMRQDTPPSSGEASPACTPTPRQLSSVKTVPQCASPPTKPASPVKMNPKPAPPEPKPAPVKAEPKPSASEPKPAPVKAEPKPSASEPKPAPVKAEPKSPTPEPKPTPVKTEPKPPSPKAQPATRPKTPPTKETEAPKAPPPAASPKPPEKPQASGISALTQQKRTGWL